MDTPAPRRSVPAAVAVGGAVGALVRYGTVAWGAALLGGDLLPVMLVNLAGTFALGWLIARASTSSLWRTRLPLLGAGLCGSLTTFSTLAIQLADPTRHWSVGALLAVLNLVLGVIAAVAGLRVGGQEREPTVTEARRW